ncbi:Uncharacterised protein [Mycobacteroides abscessus subsp. abscessus]|nr:Uncharacterised protein [Mycobacteroides abscessus subsp. abscessus]
MAYIANDPCTLTNERIPESPASSSMQASPYAREDVPEHPYPCRCIPSTPILPSSSASLRTGRSPCSYQR